MKKTTETRWTKMLSVRIDKAIYAQLEEEVRLERSKCLGRIYRVTMSSLVSEMLERGLSERRGFRDMTKGEG